MSRPEDNMNNENDWEKYVLPEENRKPAEEKTAPKKKSALIPVTVILFLLAAISVTAAIMTRKAADGKNTVPESSTQSISGSTSGTCAACTSDDTEIGTEAESETQPSTEETSSEKETEATSEKSKKLDKSEKPEKSDNKNEASVKTTEIKTTKQQKVEKATYINGILVVNKSYALPSNYAPGVNSEAKKAFNVMAADAAEEGIELSIRSGYRSYERQKEIYNNYVREDGKAEADRYSARPGHSEHQTGLAFDVNSLSQSFENTDEGKWLAENCWKYGFIIRYPKGKEGITGYMYEPWHIRYLGTDTAKKVHDSGLTLEEYLGIDSKYKD